MTPVSTTPVKKFRPPPPRHPSPEREDRVVWTDGMTPERWKLVEDYLRVYPEPTRPVMTCYLSKNGWAGRNAIMTARKYGIPWEELHSLGVVGLIRAAQTFDPGKTGACSFPTWVIGCVSTEVASGVRRLLSWKEQAAVSIYDKVPGVGDESLIDLVPDPKTVPGKASGADADPGGFGDDLRAAIDRMGLSYPTRKLVLTLRYGLDGGGVRTLDVVGKVIGRTRERVRQIETAALKYLRKDMFPDSGEG